VSARWLVALVLFALGLLAPERAEAYTWMVRHGYASCSNCHLDPSGAGILNAYGRSQSEIFLRTPYGAETSDSTLGDFLFGAIQLPDALMLQMDGRATEVRIQPPDPAPAQTRFILMQADAAAAIVVDRLMFAGAIGYVHEGALAASVTHGDEDRVVSRYHWAGYALGADQNFILRAGRMNLPYGLRVIEHPLWIKSETNTDINAAQQHGVSLYFGTENWRGEAMAIAGNLQLHPRDLREYGYSAYLERSLGLRAVVGASSLITHTSYDLLSRERMFRQAHGLYGKYSPIESLVLMAEADFLVRSPEANYVEYGTAALLQVDFEPTRGLHVIGTGELWNPEFGKTPSAAYGGWFSLAWFFLPHMDLRLDVTQRNFASLDDRVNIRTYVGQIHAFL
jgi:hypothetical protein